MSDTLIEKVNFDLIRYANCWEDADILLKGLAIAPGEKILSIASAGDNSFSLLTQNPEIVIAIDVNKIQGYVVALKKCCFEQLEYEETLSFLGFTIALNREQVFNKIKKGLSAEARSYWERNPELISNGIIYAGKFEKYFILFNKHILPLIHSRKKVHELFKIKTEQEQEMFYQEKWDTLRWRLLFKLFFSKYVMGKLGRDPAFLKEVNVPVADYIYNKAGQHLKSKNAQMNFILHFNLNGNFGQLLPHYLQRENYENIRSNIDRLKIMEGYAQDTISTYGNFDGMNLSNIFEYMDEQLFRETAVALINGINKGGRLAYWNLMVPRRISALLSGTVEYKQELSSSLSKIDKGFFYKQFIVDRKS